MGKTESALNIIAGLHDDSFTEIHQLCDPQRLIASASDTISFASCGSILRRA
jgi:hypothetical protein